jgi:purine-binding chemotaxis protein CheW
MTTHHTTEQREVVAEGQFLSFLLGGEGYGVPLLAVREIIEFRDITPVPMTPDCLLGVLNLRGSVVPVVDLCQRLGLQKKAIDKRSCIVIVEVDVDAEAEAEAETRAEQLVVGMLVDSVQEVIFLEEGLKPTPEISGRPDLRAIKGIASVNDSFILIIDCQAALSLDALGQITASNQPEPPSQPLDRNDSHESAGL